jgi:DNA-binding NarL/FixJ family response regulator
MRKTRILLADDHTLICAGFKQLLEPDFEVVGIVADGHALLQAAAELEPDVVLLDVGMPLLNGLDAARELKKRMPKVKFIFVTMSSDVDVAAEALRIGASAYLLKNSASSELLQAIRDVIRGVSYVTPTIKQAMEQSFIRDPRAMRHSKALSHRQTVVLQMLAEGRSMKEIAYDLQIAYRTVRFHKSRIMEELQLTTNSGLVMYALKSGVISPSQRADSPRDSDAVSP